MSQSHGIKTETTDEAFQEQCSLWDRGASLTFFKIYDMNNNINGTEGKERKRKEKKKNIAGIKALEIIYDCIMMSCQRLTHLTSFILFAYWLDLIPCITASSARNRCTLT